MKKVLFLTGGVGIMLFICLLKITAYAHSETGTPGRDLNFIENKGQWEGEVRFKTELPDGALFITDKGFVYNFENAADRKRLEELTCGQLEKGLLPADISNEIVHYHAYKVNFIGAQPPSYTSTGRKSYYHNYFLGNEPGRWAGNVGVYEKVVQHDIYEGIDLAIYSHNGTVKYDFVIAPGADPAQIVLDFEGVQPELTTEGNLSITTSVNEIIERAPYVYQVIHGREVKINSRYRLAEGRITYELLEDYHPEYTLIIDPELVFSTYSGATGSSHLSYATTYDKSGNLYAGAYASSIGWPTTTGAFQLRGGGGTDVGINKYNATGSALLYSTYYGGRSTDYVNAMITNDRDELIIAGNSNSTNLPYTTGCYDSTANGDRDIFIAHFNTTGTALVGATYIGSPGTDPLGYTERITMSPMEVALDRSGNIWVASSTNSSAFPVTTNAFRPLFSGGYGDGVLFQLNPDCSRLLYSTYLGGSDKDYCFNVIVNRAGNIVVCGATSSTDFPVTAGAMHTTPRGGEDGFVCIIDPVTGGLLQSTYIGTTDFDHAYRLQVDKEDNILVLGTTLGNYPVSSGVYHISLSDIFIDKLSATLDRSLSSTRLGNPQNTALRFIPSAFLYDICNKVYVSGFNSADRLPTTPDAFQTSSGGFWFCVFEPGFDSLKYASYFGAGHTHTGIHRFDPMGITYQTVCSPNNNFPITANAAFPKKLNTGLDNLSFKFDFQSLICLSRFELGAGQRDSGCVPYMVDFVNTSVFPDSTIWDFGDGSPLSYTVSPRHIYTQPGVYQVALYIRNDSSCNVYDTSYRTIQVFYAELPDIAVRDTLFCQAIQNTDLTVTINNQSRNTRIQWGPVGGILTPPDQATVNVDPNISNIYYVTIKDTVEGVCGFSISDTLRIDLAPRILNILNIDSSVCVGAEIGINTEFSPRYSYLWTPSTGVSDPRIPNPFITVNEAITYTLTASYPGCADTAVEIYFDNNYTVVDLGEDKILCTGDSLLLIAGDSYHNFLWNTGDTTSRITVYESGQYWVTVAEGNCKGEADTVNITFYPYPDLKILNNDTTICDNSFLQLSATGASNYEWTPADYLNDPYIENPVAAPLQNMTYYLTGSFHPQCERVDSIRILVNPSPVVDAQAESDTTKCFDQLVHLYATGAASYIWEPEGLFKNNKVAEPLLSLDKNTLFYVTGTNEYGCISTDSVFVIANEETQLFIPNAFSPNGDGFNDFFLPVTNCDFRSFSFSVYNRYGELVFYTNQKDKGWDGSHKNEPATIGTYFWYWTGIYNNDKKLYKKGDVTLIR